MKNGAISEAAVGKPVRIRRSWYRRRLRVRRTLGAVVVGVLLAGVCWLNAARHFPLLSFQSSQVSGNTFWLRGNVHKNLALMAAQTTKPPKVMARNSGAYPYSVVPGGVKDLNDLHRAALRDYVVRRHYSRFDYDHARLIRATEARKVYLSYRIRDTVFWTRKQFRLHVGELLLTDGKITARAHCGNQISDTAKPEVSEEEPAEDVLDQPVAAMESPAWPGRPMLMPPDLPAGQPTPPQLFAGGFIFPYVPVGVPIALNCPVNDLVDHHCKPKHRKQPVVPEPSTMVLIASGMALILWRYQRTGRPAKA